MQHNMRTFISPGRALALLPLGHALLLPPQGCICSPPRSSCGLPSSILPAHRHARAFLVCLPSRLHLIQRRLHAFLACSHPALAYAHVACSTLAIGAGPKSSETAWQPSFPAQGTPHHLWVVLPSRIWIIKPGPGPLSRPCLFVIQRTQASTTPLVYLS